VERNTQSGPASISKDVRNTNRIPFIRTGVAGVLMGLANLVPGVSGGTMVLVMGLYEQFVSAIADLTRFRFTRKSLLFIGLLVLAAAIAIGACSGVMSHLVTTRRSAMFSLFIGMTLGGAPLLYGMVKPLKGSAVIGLVLGLGLMVVIAGTKPDKPQPAEGREAVEVIEPSYARDVAAGAVGMSAMVLPGISGAYMLLVLGRYEAILAAVHQVSKFVVSAGQKGDLGTAMPVIIPVAIGAIIAMVGLSNFLKWMLHRHPRVMLGFLLGVLLGSVIGIWPFDAGAATRDYVIGVALAIAGFVATTILSRLKM